MTLHAKEARTEYTHANGGEQSEPTSGYIILAFYCGTAPKPQSEATKRTCLLVCARGVRECATNSHSSNGSVIGGECQSANTNNAVYKAGTKHV